MSAASDAQAELRTVTDAAVETAGTLHASTSGRPEARRLALLDEVPEIIGYFADGSSALAADFYDERRDAAGGGGRYESEPIVNDRTVKIRRAVAWASLPLFTEMEATVESRLAEVVQLEVARPFHDTITTNRRRDPYADGWRRVTGKCCSFCRMLGDRGAVYRESTAHFASHGHCDCTAEPVFRDQAVGPEASVMQYMASRRGRSPKQRAALRDYLEANYGD